MVSWWGTYSYVNNEQIKIGDIEIMTAACGSSGSFGSRVRSKYIGNTTYTGKWSNFRSKPAPIHGPIHKSDLNYSYSRSHFSWLPQAFVKRNVFLSHKVSYDSKIIDPVINWFSPNEVRIHFHIYDQSIVTFGIRVLWFGFSDTSHVESLDRFGKLVFDKVKNDLCIKKNRIIQKKIIWKYNMQMNFSKIGDGWS